MKRKSGPAKVTVRKAADKVRRIVKALKAAVPPPQSPYNLKKASFSEVRNAHFDGKPCERVVIILRGSGCRWARTTGGCTMCGHTAAQVTHPVAPMNFVGQFRAEHAKYDFSKNPILCLYNNGSYLNDAEMPPTARSQINRMIAGDTRIREVVFETRADSVTSAKLRQLRAELPETRIVIAMGLESANDLVRDLCICKGLSLEAFKRAAALVLEEGLDLRTYVLLKPPFLTEKEAIDDAVGSVRFAASLGGAVHIECCTVQGYTLVNYLEDQGTYRPPWLWSIVEVLRRTDPIPVYVTPFKYIPLPTDVPHNCKKCNAKMSKAILVEYNRSFDRSVLSDLRCQCRTTWTHELSQPPVEKHLPTRIVSLLKGLPSPAVASEKS